MDFEMDFSVTYDRADDAPRSPKWLGFLGPVHGTISDIQLGESGTGNKTVDIFVKVEDEDAKGVVIRTLKIPVTGVDKTGKPNILRFMRYLDSVFTFQHESEDAAKAAVQKLIGQKKSADAICKNLIGKKVAVYAGTHTWRDDDGLPVYMCQAKRALLKSEYMSAREQGGQAFRKALPPEIEAWHASRSAGLSRDAAPAAPAAPVAADAPAGATAAVDPLSIF